MKNKLKQHKLELFALLLLFLYCVFFFRGVLVKEESYFHLDFLQYFFPARKFIHQSLANGVFPLWNPFSFAGISFVADLQSGLFFPLNWPLFFMEPLYSMNLQIFLTFLVAGVGMFCLMRSFSLSVYSSFFSAFAFMMQGAMHARVIHPTYLWSIALVPFVFYYYIQLREKKNLSSFVGSVFFISLHFLCGHPQLPVYTACIFGITSFLDFLRSLLSRKTFRESIQSLLLLASVYILAVLLCAVQFLPFLELLQFSARAKKMSLEFASTIPLNLGDFSSLFFPKRFGYVQAEQLGSWGVVRVSAIIEYLCYIGVPALFFALLSCLVGVERFFTKVKFSTKVPPTSLGLLLPLVIVLFSLSIACSAGTPLANLFFNIPVLGGFRGWARAKDLFIFLLCIQAGLGLEHLLKNSQQLWLPKLLKVTTLVFVLLLCVSSYYSITVGGVLLNGESLSRIESISYFKVALFFTSCVFATFCLRNKSRVVVIIALLVVDLTFFATSFNPKFSYSGVLSVSESEEYLKSQEGSFRVASFFSGIFNSVKTTRSLLDGNFSMVSELASLNGFNPLENSDYTAAVFDEDRVDVSYGILPLSLFSSSGNRILNIFSVRYLLIPRVVQVAEDFFANLVFSDENISIYENPNYFPRAYFVSQVEAEETKTLVDTFWDPGLEFRKVAYISPNERGKEFDSLELESNASVSVLKNVPGAREYQVENSETQFLVFSESFYPGWLATIDGLPAKIYRTNALFQGVLVPAGSAKVRFEYRPKSFKYGLAVSSAALIFLVVLGVRCSVFAKEKYKYP